VPEAPTTSVPENAGHLRAGSVRVHTADSDDQRSLATTVVEDSERWQACPDEAPDGEIVQHTDPNSCAISPDLQQAIACLMLHCAEEFGSRATLKVLVTDRVLGDSKLD
jgi:hypothetical protein